MAPTSGSRTGGAEELPLVNDSIPGSVIYQCVAERDGSVRYTYISAGVERLLGLDAQSVMADATRLRQLLVEEDRPLLADAEQAALRDAVPVDCECRWQTVTGEIRSVLCRALPRRLADDRVLWNGVITDLTAHQQAAERLHQLELLAHKEESLEALAAGIAHDFNNLLTIVEGNIALATAELTTGSPGHQLLGNAEEASRRAADLCQQLLAYVGRASLSFSPVQLNPLLRDAAGLCAASLAKDAQLHWNLADRLPPVHADANRLRQVILNLLINASEAIGNQPGHVTIATGCKGCRSTDLQSLWIKEPMPAGEYAFLEVADSGCGIEPAMLKRVFDPFFSTKLASRGLGLATVLGIVRSHRGTIQVQSEPGRGSTFRIWLPALVGVEIAAAPVATPTTDWRGTGTILVVDDEEGIRILAERMLKRLGFDTLAAANGLEAVEIYRENARRIWAVLLDLTMPWMGGEATFRELVRIDKNVRVVLSSGYAKDDIMARFGERGPAGFLQKPYKQNQLSDVLQSLKAKQHSDEEPH